MAMYLDDLIRQLEADADEQRIQIKQSATATKKVIRRSTGQLNRTLQRIDVLRQLRSREAQRVPTRAVATTQRRPASRQVSRSQAH